MTQRTYKTERKATLVGKNATVEAVLQDISLSEAGVITPRGAREGTELELIFEIPAFTEFKTLSLKTVVTHRHSSGDHTYLKLGYAELSTQDYDIILDFLEYKQRLIDMGKRPSVE